MLTRQQVHDLLAAVRLRPDALDYRRRHLASSVGPPNSMVPTIVPAFAPGLTRCCAPKIKAEIIGHFSDVDEWEPYDGIQSLEGRMKDAGLDVSFYTYPGLAHWFVEEDRPEFNSEAAALAWDRTLQFLKTNS